LTPTPVRPVHLTLGGLAVGAIAGAVLLRTPDLAPVAGALVLAAWFFDRADGQLARRQGTVTAWGAWLDANCDELLDVGLHAAVAAAAAAHAASHVPWLLLAAFLAGKYLFMHGVAIEEHLSGEQNRPGSLGLSAGCLASSAGCLGSSAASPQSAIPKGSVRPITTDPRRAGGSLRSTPTTPKHAMRWPEEPKARPASRIVRAVHAAYHLPADADVRVHLLAAAMCTGWLWAELAIVAGYYNLRWVARYVLVARRLGAFVPRGGRP
jgi:phosphatidylglycerophosphate synthase